MTWLVMLYPPRWRRRYGAELANLIAAQPFSVGTAIDLVAGAVDAWIHPQLLAAPAGNGEPTMLAKVMQLKCAGYGQKVTPEDVRKSLLVTLGGTILLLVASVWLLRQFPRNPYVLALSTPIYMIPWIMSLRYTSLKGRSPGAQAVFIGGLSGLIIGLSLLAGWLSVRF